MVSVVGLVRRMPVMTFIWQWSTWVPCGWWCWMIWRMLMSDLLGRSRSLWIRLRRHWLMELTWMVDWRWRRRRWCSWRLVLRLWRVSGMCSVVYWQVFGWSLSRTILCLGTLPMSSVGSCYDSFIKLHLFLTKSQAPIFTWLKNRPTLSHTHFTRYPFHYLILSSFPSIIFT